MCTHCSANKKIIDVNRDHVMLSLKELSKMGMGTMVETIGIEILEIGDNFVSGKMPVDYRTTQPFGLLHGGASAAFAETLGSIAGMLKIDSESHMVVGKSLNCKHIRSVKDGWVYGRAVPFEIDETTQVWLIKIKDEKDALVCSCRLALAVIEV